MKLHLKWILFFLSHFSLAQQVNSDSLLVVTNQYINHTHNYSKAKQIAQYVLKKTPEYLDFKLALGRIYSRTKQQDSARYCFHSVINKNPRYKEAYIYLVQLEIEQQNSVTALETLAKGKAVFPSDSDFDHYIAQLLLDEVTPEKKKHLKEVLVKYAMDTTLLAGKQAVNKLQHTNTIGIQYSVIGFDRKGIGPWHFTGIQFLGQRKGYSIMAQINYSERGSTLNQVVGVQYELESYFTLNKKSYSSMGVGYSPSRTFFPSRRLACNYFYTFNKGWETEVGMRYAGVMDRSFFSSVIGLSKYMGSYLFNFKSYMPFFDNRVYPAFTFNTRYYFNTKYDYMNAYMGYGTSPDERILLGSFNQRLVFNSYRVGIGGYKLVYTRWIAGLQLGFNYQEFIKNRFQKEYSIFASLQYKF